MSTRDAEPSIAELASFGRLRWEKRRFHPTDLDGCLLVVTSCDDNAAVFRAAEEKNVLCNAADDPEHCRFTFGSTILRDNLAIAISTNGVAPALAVRLRERFEREIGIEYALFTSILGELRKEIVQEINDFAVRRDLWYELVDSPALDLIRQGRPDEARQVLRRMVDQAKQASRASQVG